ncbi:outer membrane protein ompU [Vibrio ishigakensis]|uniref:Outer membrane protein ompU n=1 Tax=Vibrio ishigakensis TaxID=1481914 RepID=A0A0B8P7L2_9VIBR|nr:outer membrane protein ompU [Vibrio ishigakensis]
MKLKLVTIAVASTFAAPFATAATVFQDDKTTLNIGGRAEVRGNFSDANKTDKNGSSYSDASRVRLSVDGTQKMSEDVSFFGKYEFELTENEDGTKDDVAVNTRHLFAGVQSTYGNFYYGHQNNAVTYLTDWTDMAETYSGYINEYTVATADRAKNVLKYEMAFDNGLSVHVDGNFNSDSESAQSNGYGAVVAYALPMGVEVGIGYASSDETYGAGNKTDRSDAYMAAAKYTNDNGLWLAALYQGGSISKEGVKGSDYNAADAYLGYAFGDNNVNLTYSYFSADDIKELDINFIGLEYARYIGDMAFFGSYKINLLGEGQGGIGDNDQDEIMLGMRYTF